MPGNNYNVFKKGGCIKQPPSEKDLLLPNSA
jgi:hypothetical protein